MSETKSFKLGALEKVAYASGQTSYSLQATIMQSYTVLFLTTAVGLDPVKVGLMTMLARFIDAFTDIGFSLLGDRTKTKLGSYRPWFIAFMGIASLFTGMFFHVPGSFLSDTTKTWIWVSVTYIVLTCICQTVSATSVGAMGILVSPEDRDRKTLATLRQWGQQAGSFIVYLAGMPILLAFSANKEVPDADGFHALGWIVAGISLVAAVLYAVKVKERVPVNTTGEKVPLSKSLKALGKNNIAWGCMIVTICCMFMIALTGGMNSYVFIYVFQNPAAMSASATIAMVVSLMSTTFLVPALTKRFGRVKCFLIGAGIEIVAAVCFWIASGARSIVLHTIAYAIFTSMNSMIMVVTYQSLPDANMLGEYVTGYSNPGIVNAVISFAQKVAMGLSSFVMAAMMTVIHFDNALGANQKAETVMGIRIVAAGAIVCMMAIALVGLVVLNHVKQDRLEQMRAEVEARHAAKTED